jgi:1,4-alpha-glucan branching enzyme
LNEATFECYLPLLETAHRLVAEGLSPKWTINLSPVLVEQLASPEFQKELVFYYQNVRRACTESRAHFQREGNAAIVALTHYWEEFYERMWELHRRIGGDIPGTFGDLQRAGHLEIITCAATHGYLPLLSTDESIHLQLRTAVEAHKRHFGQAPRGIWLPECAYRPRYEWTPPTGTVAVGFARASRSSWPRTTWNTSSPTLTWWRPASRSSSIATTSPCASRCATSAPRRCR